MAWKYSDLQQKLSSIQAQLLVTMEQKSECADQLMHISSNDTQDNHETKGISLKRKAEDYFPVNMDNKRSWGNFQTSESKISRPCLMMLDMYTQTDRTLSADISLSEVYDLLKRNSERLQRIEDTMMMKLNTSFDGVDHGTKVLSHVATSIDYKKPSSASFTSTSVARPSFIGTNYSCMPGQAFPTVDYSVTPSNEIGDWAQERHDIVPSVSTAPTTSENRLEDVTTEKISPKEEWNCETNSLANNTIVFTQGEGQPSGPGCWLADIDDVNNRAWFSGDTKIIDRCESYGVNPVKLALSLTEALFTREEMAASNVRGTRGKESLDSSKIKAIRGHVDYRYPIDEDRMEVRWQLIKPKIDSKCRSQRRLQREHKWKSERRIEKPPPTCPTPRQKKPVLDIEEREMLLYGSPKTILNPVTPAVVRVYTEDTSNTSSFTDEGQDGYLRNPDE